MNSVSSSSERSVSARPIMDVLTIIAIAAMVYVIAAALHEHVGHALACFLLGARVTELNAFYVNCDYQTISDSSIRAVALAGPLISLMTGIVAFAALKRLSSSSAQLKLCSWLLGSIGWMTATGYLLFSGATGLGDFGVSRDGMLFNASPEWLWRSVIFILGVASYALAMRMSIREMEKMIGGSGLNRITRARHLALTSYLAGGLVSVLIGLFNPAGIVIVLISAAAATLGGTSGLAWETQFMGRNKQTSQPLFQLERQWLWIVVAAVIVLIYGIVLGPSIKL
jgi:hypothetical protein